MLPRAYLLNSWLADRLTSLEATHYRPPGPMAMFHVRLLSHRDILACLTQSLSHIQSAEEDLLHHCSRSGG